VRHLERMDEQHAIDRSIRQRQIKLVDERRQRRSRGRPLQHALRRWHEGQATLRLLAEQSEVRGCIADAQNPHASGIGKARANAAPDEAPRRYAQALGIEIAQVDYVV
jgi:hypothetical protein